MQELIWFASGVIAATAIGAAVLVLRRKSDLPASQPGESQPREIQPNEIPTQESDEARRAEIRAEAQLLRPRQFVLGETRPLRELADSIGTELASLATGVEGQSQLLCESLGDPNKVGEHAEQLWETVRRLRFFSEKVQSFSHVAELTLQPTDIGQLLASLVLDIENYSTGSLQVSLTNATALPLALADPAALRSAVLFLRETVFEVEPSASTLLLRAYSEEHDDGQLLVGIDIEAVLEDGGEIQARPAPDALFSSLAARNLLKAQGATLELRHSPGLCAAASIKILATQTASARTEPSGAAADDGVKPHRFGGVLIVEGNPTIRHMLSRELDKTQRNIIVCADGAAATSLFRATPERFELLILEQESRRLRGEDMALAALKERPELKILLLTPGPGSAVNPDLTAHKHLRILHKPFGLMELRDGLWRSLGPEPTPVELPPDTVAAPAS